LLNRSALGGVGDNGPQAILKQPTLAPRRKLAVARPSLNTMDSSTSTSSKIRAREGMTVVELKAELKQKNLPVGGVKAELLARLEESDLALNAHVKVRGKDSSSDSGSTGGDLWFDDSVFDEAKTTKTSSRSRTTSTESKEEFEAASSLFERGQAVQASVTGYGPLGASVVLLLENGQRAGTGLILQQDITFWEALHGSSPRIGETVPAFIQLVRGDGKVDVTLRPVGFDKVLSARDQMLAALEKGEGKKSGSVLALGDKSTPEEVWSLFPGMSKSQFKGAIGALLREGAITVAADTITYIPVDKRVPVIAAPYSGKSPRGWRVPEGCTLFVANLPFVNDPIKLAQCMESKIGNGHIATIKMITDEDTGKAKGIAYVSLFSVEETQMALTKLKGVKMDNRELRFELQLPQAERERLAKASVPSSSSSYSEQGEVWPVAAAASGPRDWGESSSHGRKLADGTPVREVGANKQGGNNRKDMDNWITVFVGDLPYAITEDSLKFLIEDSLGEQGKGAVASVRLNKDKDTGRPRGFGYLDFFDMETAELAVKQLNGMTVMGRPMRLDLEGKKKRRQDLGRDARGSGGDWVDPDKKWRPRAESSDSESDSSSSNVGGERRLRGSEPRVYKPVPQYGRGGSGRGARGGSGGGGGGGGRSGGEGRGGRGGGR